METCNKTRFLKTDFSLGSIIAIIDTRVLYPRNHLPGDKAHAAQRTILDPAGQIIFVFR